MIERHTRCLKHQLLLYQPSRTSLFSIAAPSFCRSGPPSTDDATIRYCNGTSTQPVAVKREVVLQLCAQHSWNCTRRRFNERKETSIHIRENQPVVDTKSRVKVSFSDHCFDSTNGIVSPTTVKYIIYNII